MTNEVMITDAINWTMQAGKSGPLGLFLLLLGLGIGFTIWIVQHLVKQNTKGLDKYMDCVDKMHTENIAARERSAEVIALNTEISRQTNECMRDITEFMKKKMMVLIATSTLLVSLVGCASTPKFANLTPTTQANIVSTAEVAAYGGTRAVLLKNPEYRKGFEQALGELKLMEAGNVDALVLVDIIKRLPVKELRGDTAAIVIDTATIFIVGRIGATPIEQINDLKPVVSALIRGIELALDRTKPVALGFGPSFAALN